VAAAVGLQIAGRALGGLGGGGGTCGLALEASRQFPGWFGAGGLGCGLARQAAVELSTWWVFLAKASNARSLE